jgi:hypothetical protein
MSPLSKRMPIYNQIIVSPVGLRRQHSENPHFFRPSGLGGCSAEASVVKELLATYLDVRKVGSSSLPGRFSAFVGELRVTMNKDGSRVLIRRDRGWLNRGRDDLSSSQEQEFENPFSKLSPDGLLCDPIAGLSRLDWEKWVA